MHIFLKVFEQFSQLEKALKSGNNLGIPVSDFSILTIMNPMLSNSSEEWLYIKDKLELNSKKLLGAGANSGILKSQEYGSIFISGKLTSLFLYEVEGKALGELSTGIYGVFRGLGTNQENLDLQLIAFKEGSFMLVARAEEKLLKNLIFLLLDSDKNSFLNSNLKKAI